MALKTKDARVAPKVPRPAPCYSTSFQAERFHQGIRYHWMICDAQTPDQLISWGHAATQELAEAAARNEISDLSAGLTQGGRVPCTTKPFTRR